MCLGVILKRSRAVVHIAAKRERFVVHVKPYAIGIIYRTFVHAVNIYNKSVEIKGKNKTIDLLNEGEINFLKTPGLSKITLPLMLPMLTGDKRPDYYLGLFEKTMVNRETTRLKLIRSTPDGLPLFDTDLKVSIENYKIKEDAEEGLDMFVDVELLQYRDLLERNIKLITLRSVWPADELVPVEKMLEKRPPDWEKIAGFAREYELKSILRELPDFCGVLTEKSVDAPVEKPMADDLFSWGAAQPVPEKNPEKPEQGVLF